MTVCIDNAQNPLIIDSGAHCSIVARNYCDNHFPNWRKQLLQPKAKNFKSASGRMTSIGTIIKEITIPHRKGNIRLNPELVVLDDAHIQGFLLGTDYQRMYGINIYNSKNRHITIGTNKEEKFSLDIYQISAHDPVEELLNEFREGQFSTTLTTFAICEESLGKTRGHDIELYLDVERPHPPILRRPPYPASLETRKEIKKHINELLDMDVIRKMGQNEIVEITTTVLITWNDGKSRLCGDFRALNNYTKAYRYPIRRIPPSLNKLAKAKYITKMDCIKGFHQNGSKTNSMKLLRIICHMELLALGHKVSGLSLAIDKNKVAEVLHKPVPRNIKEMQSFLGFSSYYRNQIKNLSHIASSLYKLCSKDVFFEITKERRDAYEKIKHELTNALVLILPDFEPPFKLYIDAACSQGLGAALHQRQIVDGEPREGVICFISRQLEDSEARYEVTQTKCLCLVWALETLHYYLEGSVFEVYTDFTAFKSLLNMKTNNRHMLRWKIAIQEYRGNMTITYKEGKCQINADGLQRWPLDNVKSNTAYDPEVEANIPIHFMEIDRRKNFRFSEWEPGSGTSDGEDTDSEGAETPILGISSSEMHNELFSAVMKTYSKHKQCGILLQLLQQKYRSPELESQLEGPWLRDYKDKKFFLIDGLLYHREKHTSSLTIVDRDHISFILQECHYCPYMGHMSEDRTKERVASTAWWPKLEQELS
ncbi:hypothetical protein O181_076217 [Austropuccinia psidii MF-1]|uniref:RNA-directed DNA polymerase n=1 Tax=Austropuccinia psidii MF-1 TaxID=1389203 RepID=A0A9Q3IDK9_9BASI|nr:hypothetical protein [Austropuccinia psidii MF-1]